MGSHIFRVWLLILTKFQPKKIRVLQRIIKSMQKVWHFQQECFLSYTSATVLQQKLLIVLRKNYQCLGITCEDIGGLWDKKEGTTDPQEYYPGAEPCTTDYGDYVAGN